MEANTDSTQAKKPRHPSKKLYDQKYNRKRINIGDAFERWKRLKAQKDFKTNAELANFLLDRYEGLSTSTPRMHCLKAPGRSTYPSKPPDWKSATVHDILEPPSTPPPVFPSPPEVFTEDDLTGKHASIAHEDCLKQLATFLRLPVLKCPYRCNASHVECQCRPPFHVSISSRGTASIMEWTCPSGHTVWRWSSQPTVKCGIQAGDFMLATNILLSGSNYSSTGMKSDARLACLLLDREMAESEDMLSAEESADSVEKKACSTVSVIGGGEDGGVAKRASAIGGKSLQPRSFIISFKDILNTSKMVVLSLGFCPCRGE